MREQGLSKFVNKGGFKAFYGFGEYFIAKNVFVALRGFYGACRCIVGLCGVLWWLRGVSIITMVEKGKANPLKKRKKNLTRVYKKSILNLRGVEKFL